MCYGFAAITEVVSMALGVAGPDRVSSRFRPVGPPSARYAGAELASSKCAMRFVAIVGGADQPVVARPGREFCRDAPVGPLSSPCAGAESGSRAGSVL